jgi:hypothetical protein
VQLRAVLFLCTTLIACGSSQGGDSTAATTFDPCSPLSVLAAMPNQVQQDGVAAAAQLWRVDGAPGVGIAGGTSIDVHFQTAAPMFHGLYDDRAGEIYINEDLVDVRTLSIVIAHELGHAFGLQHVSPDVRPSVMNPDNLTIAPTAEDRQALESLWGACASGS